MNSQSVRLIHTRASSSRCWYRRRCTWRQTKVEQAPPVDLPQWLGLVDYIQGNTRNAHWGYIQLPGNGYPFYVFIRLWPVSVYNHPTSHMTWPLILIPHGTICLILYNLCYLHNICHSPGFRKDLVELISRLHRTYQNLHPWSLENNHKSRTIS